MEKNPIPKTVAELRAILDARKPYTQAIYDAIQRGNMDAFDAAQKRMRKAFPNG
jgi:hypothetical protein